jgi:hypothetical protein
VLVAFWEPHILPFSTADIPLQPALQGIFLNIYFYIKNSQGTATDEI